MKLFKNKQIVTIITLSVCFLIVIGFSNTPNSDARSQPVSENYMSKLNNGLSNIRGYVGAPINSLQKIIFRAGGNTRNYFSLLFNYSSLKQENEELKKQNDLLEEKSTQYEYVKNINKELKSNLNLKDRTSNYKYVSCNIVTKNGSSGIDSYTIDKGAKDGISNGMIVITDKGLFGQISYTSKNWSIAKAIYDNNSISVMTTNVSNDNLQLKNNYNRYNNIKRFSINLEDDNVKVGDIIITASSYLYPKGIILGKVVELNPDQRAETRDVSIESFIDFNNVNNIDVLIPIE